MKIALSYKEQRSVVSHSRDDAPPSTLPPCFVLKGIAQEFNHPVSKITFAILLTSYAAVEPSSASADLGRAHLVDALYSSSSLRPLLTEPDSFSSRLCTAPMAAEFRRVAHMESIPPALRVCLRPSSSSGYPTELRAAIVTACFPDHRWRAVHVGCRFSALHPPRCRVARWTVAAAAQHSVDSPSTAARIYRWS